MCRVCRMVPAGCDDMIEFLYAGFNIRVSKNSVICAGCRKREFMQIFDRWREKLKLVRDETVRLDWRVYQWSRSYNQAAEELDEILLGVGVFQKEASGGWEVRYFGTQPINPGRSYGLYFTCPAYAKAYAQTVHDRYMKHWSVHYIAKKISRR